MNRLRIVVKGVDCGRSPEPRETRSEYHHQHGNRSQRAEREPAEEFLRRDLRILRLRVVPLLHCAGLCTLRAPARGQFDLLAPPLTKVAKILLTGRDEGMVRMQRRSRDADRPPEVLLRVVWFSGDFAHDPDVVQRVGQVRMARPETRFLQASRLAQQVFRRDVVTRFRRRFCGVDECARFACFRHAREEARYIRDAVDRSGSTVRLSTSLVESYSPQAVGIQISRGNGGACRQNDTIEIRTTFRAIDAEPGAGSSEVTVAGSFEIRSAPRSSPPRALGLRREVSGAGLTYVAQ